MSQPLEEIQDAVLERLHAGERIDREAVLAAHPDHARSLGAFLDLLAVIEGDAVAGGPETTRLGEFRIVREVGRGGMGIVYEAEQPSLRRRVALKVLPPTLRMDPRLVSRFHREAEAAGRLRHPGIVPVFSVGEAAGAPFFAMELVEGASLEDHIARWRAGDDRPDRRAWSLAIAAKVADALAYAHGEGILHRDVKPGNVIVDTSGEPRLTDFGLALDMRAPGLTMPGETFGSPRYMSPEQAVRRESPVDERTDVYSLAVTLYEMLTLRLPYDATTSAELLTALAAGRLVPPRQVDPTIPEALEAVLLRALRNDPRERYEDAAAFAADLRACAESRAPVGAAWLAPVPPRATPRRTWVLPALVGVGVLFLLVLPLAGGALLFARKVEEPPRAPERTHVDVDVLDGAGPRADATVRVAAGWDRQDVGFWLALEELLGRVPERSWPELLESYARSSPHSPDAVLERRRRGREVAETFCREWNETLRVGDAETERRYARLESDLRSAGAAAAPHLMEILSRHPRLTFGNGDPSRGPTARTQVRALHAVGMLELRAAIPHVVFQCRGPSQTQVSTASIVLEKLTGEDFDARFLKRPSLATIDWWSKNAAKDRLGLDHLVRHVIADLRAGIDGAFRSGGPIEDAMRQGRSWWNSVGEKIVEDLAALLDTSLPFEETENPAAQRDQVDRIEAWWRRRDR